MTTNDMELVRQYAASRSENAFAALVERHTNLVYSASLRVLNNPQLAEEATQTVFLLLAHKADSLTDKTILSGWLYRAACYTSNSIFKREYRRQHREQEAYMQSTLHEIETAAAWQQMSPLLEEAMLRLGQNDRDALVLRFFEGRSLNEVGLSMRSSEAAAKKRVTRALEKLRKFFTKRGVSSTAAIIAVAISANSVQAAPITLSKSVTAAVLAKGGIAGGSTLFFAKATLFTMKTKTAIATTVAAVLILGAGTYFACRAMFRHSAKVSQRYDVIPIKLNNLNFRVNTNELFVIDTDPDTRRTPDSNPAGHIKSLPAAAFPSGKQSLMASQSIGYGVANDSPLLGKRIRISAWMKLNEVTNWVGTLLYMVGKDGFIYALDDMTDRPLSGTADWQQVEMITDVPNEPCFIYLTSRMNGTGEMWFDDFQIDLAAPDAATTDDQRWHKWSATPNAYTITTDANNSHEGNNTYRFAYVPKQLVPGSWMCWGHAIRDAKQYRGHTVRFSMWIKSEDILGVVGPNLRPKALNGKLLKSVGQPNSRGTVGTTDWTHYSIDCIVPKNTTCLDAGIYFGGSGKFWIDSDTIKLDIVK